MIILYSYNQKKMRKISLICSYYNTMYSNYGSLVLLIIVSTNHLPPILYSHCMDAHEQVASSKFLLATHLLMVSQ